MITNTEDLTQEQYDRLLSFYVDQVIDSMDTKTLIVFATEQLEANLRDSCSTPMELCEEIECAYDKEFLDDLLSQLD